MLTSGPVNIKPLPTNQMQPSQMHAASVLWKLFFQALPVQTPTLFLSNWALGKDFHPIFKFSVMEHYPFCTHSSIEKEKIQSVEPMPIAQNPFT